MPFKSEKQRRFLWSKHPEIARRWSKEYGSTPEDEKKTDHKKKRKIRHRRTAGTSDKVS